MSDRLQGGTALAVGLILLTLVMLLGLAGAGTARTELLVAQNDTFRENASLAASAGIEMAINEIMASADPGAVDTVVTGSLPGASWTARVRFMGFEHALPQAPAANLAGAHFEILSTGRSARRASDTQRAGVMWVTAATGAESAADCEPIAPRHCHEPGKVERLYWLRVPVE